MPLILGANSLAGGYQVKNSLRFNSGSSDYLNRTMTTATNNKIYTWSGWIKKTTIGESAPNIFGAHSGGYRDCIRFDGGGNALQMIFNEAITANLVTTQLLRDVSAWYHIVVAVDTTQATSTNRVKIYLNGSQITSFSTSSYPPQNYTNIINGANVHVFGKNADLSNEYFNGYMSEIYFIDGQALTPSSFGETDEDTGIWKPKAYTGTFGTNGFYLDFEDSANLGNDMSGNNNDFTVNNLTSIDQTTDTPTNNFCTLNPLVAGSTGFTEGNLKWTNTSGGWSQRLATFMFSAGKWYAEMKVDTKGDTIKIGIQLPTLLDTFGGGELNNSYFYLSDGRIRNNGANVTTGLSTFTDGDIIGIAVDVTNSLLYFYKNGTLVNSGGTSITSGQDWVIGCGAYDAGTDNVVSWNFGNPPYSSGSYTDGAGYGNFSYAVPSGYYSLCTKNLAQFG